jgi:hypothetical protein
VTLARCTACQAEFEAPDGQPGFVVSCPKCKGEVRVAAQPPPLVGTGMHLSSAPGSQPRRPTIASAIGAFIGPAPAAAPESPAGEVQPVEEARHETERFGHYELISRMSTSDVSVTYRARRVDESTIVVLKVLAPGKTVTREEIACITERARRARALDHPNIARLIEISRADGTDFIASEYVEGKPLSIVIDSGVNTVGESIELGGALAEALEAAHREGVVHGNLKPSNIVVDNHEKPKITDFGMAREFWRVPHDQLKHATADRIPLPYYMAIEQIRGGEPTPRTDIFALGGILYHLLAKRPPFVGRSLAEVVLEVDRGSAPPPSTYNLRVPASVDAIVMKCLAKDPADRFGTAGELAAQIDHFLRGRKVVASAPGPARRLARALRARLKTAVAVVVVAAASATAAHYAARSGKVAAIRGADAVASAEIADALSGCGQGLWLEAASRLTAIAANAEFSEPVRARALAGLGLAEMRSGKPRDAAAAFARALALRPGDAQLHYLLATTLWHAGDDPAKVELEMRESLRLEPARAASARYQYDYARACVGAGMRDAAKRAFEKVKALDPSYRPQLVESHLAALDPPGQARD